MERHELFKELTEAFGPSGYETDVRAIMTRYFGKNLEVTTDRLGSVIGYREGDSKGPKLLLAAHMDEVGFMVKKITKQGYIYFLPLGGWWPQVLLSQRVKVRTRKGDFDGIVGSKAPHAMKEEERKKVPEMDNLFIDIGVLGENSLESTGVRPGDPIVPVSPFTPLANGILAAKAWDDRVGCAALVEIAQKLPKHKSRLYLAGTVQEEVGLRGAKTVAGAVEPDISIAIDVSLSSDAPGDDSDALERFGAGAAVLIYDSTMIPNLAFRDFVCETAEAAGIKYHLASLRGGYDSGAIHVTKTGVPSIALGLPARYIHSHVGVIYEEDYIALVRLLNAVIESLDSAKAAEIIKFS